MLWVSDGVVNDDLDDVYELSSERLLDGWMVVDMNIFWSVLVV